jgi:hypothetical protein
MLILPMRAPVRGCIEADDGGRSKAADAVIAEHCRLSIEGSASEVIGKT